MLCRRIDLVITNCGIFGPVENITKDTVTLQRLPTLQLGS